MIFLKHRADGRAISSMSKNYVRTQSEGYGMAHAQQVASAPDDILSDVKFHSKCHRTSDIRAATS